MGSTRTETIDVAVPDAEGPYRLELTVGAGTLDLSPGAGDKIVQGTVTISDDSLKPEVKISGNKVHIGQSHRHLVKVRDHFKNDWNLQLGNVPMSLKLGIGAAKGKIELGGLSLTELNVDQGASDFSLSFSQLNARSIDKLSFNAGAARSVLAGLANANAGKMSFKGGAGELRLSFDGELQRDLEVDITAAVGSVTIDVPSGTSASLKMKGALASVSAQGDWSRAGGDYRMSGSGPSIAFNVNVSVGRLELRSS